MTYYLDADTYDVLVKDTFKQDMADLRTESTARIKALEPPPAPRVQPTSRGGFTETTADISNPTYSGGYPSIRHEDIYGLARQMGLDEDAARAAQAIAITEGGLSGAIGDSGQSFGPFQFYGGGGQLNNFASQRGFADWRQAGEYVRSNPLEAAQWALQGYLGQAIRKGQELGLSGADLATYAQRYGQVSVSPERAGQNYAALMGGQIASSPAQPPNLSPMRQVNAPVDQAPTSFAQIRQDATAKMASMAPTDEAALNAFGLTPESAKAAEDPFAGLRAIGENAKKALTGIMDNVGRAADGASSPVLPDSYISRAQRGEVLDAGVEGLRTGIKDYGTQVPGPAGEVIRRLNETPLAEPARELFRDSTVGQWVDPYSAQEAYERLKFDPTADVMGRASVGSGTRGPSLVEQYEQRQPDFDEEAFRRQAQTGILGTNIVIGGTDPLKVGKAAKALTQATPTAAGAGNGTPAPPSSGGSVPAVRSTAQLPVQPGQTPGRAAVPPRNTGPQAAGAVPPSGTPPVGPTVAQTPRGGAGYTPQGPTKTVGFQQFWDRTRNVIAAQGKHGQRLADNLHASREIAERSAGDWVSRMPTVRALGKAEFDKFVDMAEGKAKSVDPVVVKAYNEWKAVRDEIWNAATASGIKAGKQSDYFPHIYEQGTFSKSANHDAAVKYLVQSGQAKTVAAAEQLMYRARDVANRKMGNLEKARITYLPGYKRDKDALFGYIEAAAKRIGQAQMFGPNYEKSSKLLAAIRKSGFDDSAAKHAFDVAAGRQLYGETQQAVAGKLRGAQVVTKMGLSLIANAGQSLNTATVTGIGNTLKAMPKAFRDPQAKEYALKIGVTLDGVIRDLREGAGWQGSVGKVGAPGFQAVEKFNRTLAAVAGREFAVEAAAKAAQGDAKALEKLGMLGLDGQAIAARGGALSQGEMDRAARSIVERTQFKVDPQDLAVWMDEPWGKLVMQFRTFSYNQTAFLAREILEPAISGKDLKPLMRYLMLAPAVGAISTEVRNVITNRRPEEDDLKRLEEYVSRVGGVGIVGDLIRGFFPRNVQYMDPFRYPSIVAGALGGPTVSTAGEGLTAGAQAVLQGSNKGMERFLLGQVPVAGATLRNTLTPYEPGGRSGSGADVVPLRDFLKQRRETSELRELRRSRSR